MIPVIDIHVGNGAVDGSPTVVLPFVQLPATVPTFMIWLSNLGTASVMVSFEASPDGVSEDQFTKDSVRVEPGRAFMQQHGPRELRRWWSIVAYSEEGTPQNVKWGISIARE
jgi:hypothetical protein